jgi:multidrug resistance protein
MTVILAAMMELIDISIVNVALSHMSGNLGATLEDVSWVITAYAIANVIVIPITSFLVAKLGRRNYYIGSIILFTTCSFLCGQATNIWTLVAFRFLQGMGGGALLSVSQAIVFELFPPEKRNTASALFGIGVFLGPTIGPTLGGFITEYYDWPWIFYINVPIGRLVRHPLYHLSYRHCHRRDLFIHLVGTEGEKSCCQPERSEKQEPERCCLHDLYFRHRHLHVGIPHSRICPTSPGLHSFANGIALAARGRSGARRFDDLRPPPAKRDIAACDDHHRHLSLYPF